MFFTVESLIKSGTIMKKIKSNITFFSLSANRKNEIKLHLKYMSESHSEDTFRQTHL